MDAPLKTTFETMPVKLFLLRLLMLHW